MESLPGRQLPPLAPGYGLPSPIQDQDNWGIRILWGPLFFQILFHMRMINTEQSVCVSKQAFFVNYEQGKQHCLDPIPTVSPCMVPVGLFSPYRLVVLNTVFQTNKATRAKE